MVFTVRWGWLCAFACSLLLSGCATRYVDIEQMEYLPPADIEPRQSMRERPAPRGNEKPAPRVARPDPGYRERVITEKEIESLMLKDHDMLPLVAYDLMARLNGKDREYIKEDVKKKRRLKVPNDFAAQKSWTPLPRNLPGAASVPKFILVVKDIPFIGWYEKGRLAADTYICIGKEWDWTKKGLFKVLEKDIDHISQSYPNAYGTPAWMPYALRIYGTVWIHGGDVIGGYCSHGCINLPLDPAQKLFAWADSGTTVLIVDSLKEVDRELKAYSGQLQPAAPQVKPVAAPPDPVKEKKVRKVETKKGKQK